MVNKQINNVTVSCKQCVKMVARINNYCDRLASLPGGITIYHLTNFVIVHTSKLETSLA